MVSGPTNIKPPDPPTADHDVLGSGPPATSPRASLRGGPDGNRWFTNTNRRIGRISVDDVIKTYNIARGRTPFDVATGADGNVWFTSLRSNRVGFVRPG